MDAALLPVIAGKIKGGLFIHLYKPASDLSDSVS
jgi:hypothetical protein